MRPVWPNFRGLPHAVLLLFFFSSGIKLYPNTHVILRIRGVTGIDRDRQIDNRRTPWINVLPMNKWRHVPYNLCAFVYGYVQYRNNCSVFLCVLFITLSINQREYTHTFVILIKVIGSFIKLSTRPKRTKKEKRGEFFLPLSPDIERSWHLLVAWFVEVAWASRSVPITSRGACWRES